MNTDTRASLLFGRSMAPDPSAAFVDPFDPAALRDGAAFATRTPLPPLRGFPVVLLNGPPRVGKDTAGRAIERSIYGTHGLKFAEAVKRGTHALYGLQVSTGHYEDSKDMPTADFHGLSPRQAYIMFSEQMTKPALGNEHFGRVMVRRIDAARRTGARLAVITDSGFASEVHPVGEAVGGDAVLLVRLHGDKRGCTFAGDSRSHLDLVGIATRDIRNEGTEPKFQAAVVAAVREWLAYRAGML